MTRRICFVTDELYPFTAGGIGRVLHNLVHLGLQRAPAVEFHLLMPSRVGVTPASVAAVFGERVHVHFANMRQGWDPSFHGDTLYPPAAAFTDSVWHAESLDFLLALKCLAEEGVSFDVVEFPDYRGWAFCTL